MKVFEILRNHPDNSKGWKVFITIMNVTLWVALADVILLLTLSSSESLWRTLTASLCTIGIVMLMFWLHSIEAPVLQSPFRKEAQEKENIETVLHETLTEFTEEFNKSVEKASKVNESEILDHSIFD